MHSIYIQNGWMITMELLQGANIKPTVTHKLCEYAIQITEPIQVWIDGHIGYDEEKYIFCTALRAMSRAKSSIMCTQLTLGMRLKVLTKSTLYQHTHIYLLSQSHVLGPCCSIFKIINNVWELVEIICCWTCWIEFYKWLPNVLRHVIRFSWSRLNLMGFVLFVWHAHL